MMSSAPVVRHRFELGGAVQGVGFRPFVYRLAGDLDLAGWVENTNAGVTIEIEGAEDRVDEFRRRLPAERPARSWLSALHVETLDPLGEAGFTIRESAGQGGRSAVVLPDIATCPACLRELRERGNRRHRYPFINCTECGPRYSIVTDLPYDRARTTMARFAMCDACAREYRDPSDRRFHAEPIACPRCGPRLEMWDASGRLQASGYASLLRGAAVLRAGGILAVKGLGGFHLAVDARDEAAVSELRRRKRREAKPLAVMVAGLEEARRHARVAPLEAALLSGPEAPIVLVPRSGHEIAASLAPGNPNIGLILPYTPLHHLLLAEIGFPIVATSGNLSDEPLCTDEREAVRRLGGIADAFLVHDREIARPVDDSVVRVIAGRAMLLRRARGYAPLPVAAAGTDRAVLAVGAHLKNTVALTANGQVIVSPHIGDLGTAPAVDAFVHTVGLMERLYEQTPSTVACDAHPDSVSSRWAQRSGRTVRPVQHHYAHVLATMADNDLEAPTLGIAWDGTGYGLDGTIWGGEALHVTAAGFTRFAWLRPFPLPGGEAAVREPRRSALGLLWSLRGDALFEEGDPRLRFFTAAERRVLRRMLARGLNCPRTSSAGRLFDAVAAIATGQAVSRFEGEAAMALEFAREGAEGDDRYGFDVQRGPEGIVLDWAPLVIGVARDVGDGVPTAVVSLRFHNTLAEMIAATARAAGERRVVLSGGCFQNKYLTERTVVRLRQEGFDPYWSKNVPPNDGGIAVGQIAAVVREQGRS
jgi:hydrogenase maturation protein HypF